MHRPVSSFFGIVFLVVSGQVVFGQFPESAEIVRDEENRIVEFSLSGKSGQDRLKVSKDTIDKILGLKSLRALTLWGTTVNDADLERIHKLQNLEILELSFTDVTGKSLESIAKLKKLVYLRLEACDVNDDHLKHLAQMPQLLMLYLRRTKLSDAGLKHIAKLKKLNALQLSDCDITDEGLKSLGHFPQLQHLWLSKTLRYGDKDFSKLTDASVDYLLTLESLIDLQIADSRLTPKGLDRLRKGLPKTKISTQRIGITYLNAKKN